MNKSINLIKGFTPKQLQYFLSNRIKVKKGKVIPKLILL
jgi:hypothetical protein